MIFGVFICSKIFHGIISNMPTQFTCRVYLCYVARYLFCICVFVLLYWNYNSYFTRCLSFWRSDMLYMLRYLLLSAWCCPFHYMLYNWRVSAYLVNTNVMCYAHIIKGNTKHPLTFLDWVITDMATTVRATLLYTWTFLVTVTCIYADTKTNRGWTSTLLI